ncbi:MAG: hypothetical protein GEU97_17855 [Actinophytocola sp.]|nr:hypothetical protein [Actinophytocola sp.]
MVARAIAAAVLVLASCASAPDASSAPANALIAEQLPRVEYLGGPFLRRPQVVTVTFAGDDPALVARLEVFGEAATRSPWWREVSDGYCAQPDDCVGDGRPGRHVRLTDHLMGEVTDVDIEDLLIGVAEDGRLGHLDRESLLLAYLPDGVTLSDAAAGKYCDGGPRAFHSALDHDGLRIAYAVVPRCGDEADLTGTASHEILEATTTPDPHRRGFAFPGGSETAGFTAAGVEPVDPCGLIAGDDRTTVDGGFAVQRAWSTHAAALGRDPCVPAPSDRPYLALVPREPAVRLAEVGDTATLDLEAAADRKTRPWRVSAVDFNTRYGRAPCVDAELDTATVTSGDTVRLTVTLRRKPPNDRCVLGLISTLDRTEHLWPVAISTR